MGVRNVGGGLPLRGRLAAVGVALLALLAVAVQTTDARAAAKAYVPSYAGGIAQLAGKEGCFSQAGNSYYDHSCQTGNGVLAADAVAVSPDGKNVYLASRGSGSLISRGSNGVVTFSRNTSSGAIRQTACITADGTSGAIGAAPTCTRGDGLGQANDIALSPDGKSLYVSSGDGGVAIFSRNTDTGAITETGCFATFINGTTCQQATAIPQATATTVSPDGKSVYVTSRRTGAIATFSRDETTGGLTYAGCIANNATETPTCSLESRLSNPTAIVISPDGKNAYVSSAKDTNSVHWFSRDPSTGLLTFLGCFRDRAPAGSGCSNANGLADASDVAIAPDGKFVYVTAIDSAGVVTFARDANNGALRQVDCITQGGSDVCRSGIELSYAGSISLSRDGSQAYVSAAGANSVSLYKRDSATGMLSLVDCVTDNVNDDYSSCTPVFGLYGAKNVVASPDGANAYVASDTGSSIAALGLGAAVSPRPAIVDKRGGIKLKVSCAAAARSRCVGSLRLNQVTSKRIVGRQTINVAGKVLSSSARFSLAAGQSSTVKVGLTAAGKRLANSRSARRYGFSAFATLDTNRGEFSPQLELLPITHPKSKRK